MPPKIKKHLPKLTADRIAKAKKGMSKFMQIVGILVFISYGATMVLVIEQFEHLPIQASIFRVVAWNFVLIYVAAEFLKRYEHSAKTKNDFFDEEQ